MKPFLLFVLLFSLKIGLAQPSEEEFKNEDFYDYHKVGGLSMMDSLNSSVMPIIDMLKKNVLQLEFDILESSPKRLFYTVRYFNKDWTPANISRWEAISSFEEIELNTYSISFNTYKPYVHYSVPISMDNLGLKLSGNYIFYVYDESGIIISKKFYVTDSRFKAEIKFQQLYESSKLWTHQSLSVTINTHPITIINPEQEIQMDIFQNGDPNKKKTYRTPNYFREFELFYNRPDGIIFPAGKEFRNVDTRRIQIKGRNVDYWDYKGNEFFCHIFPDVPRADRNYIYYPDYNGRALYLTYDVSSSQTDYAGEYINLVFTLQNTEEYSSPLFLYGQISQWKILPEYQMKYSDTCRCYTHSLSVKNGFIDYAYALSERDHSINMATIDGDWYETENDYYVLIYYRPFSGRYDQLLFSQVVNSNRTK